MNGQLLFVRKSYSLRYWVVIDGIRVRKCVSLHTDVRQVAEARAARLLSGADPSTASAPETFERAARRVVARQGIVTAGERLSRLERYAFPSFGALTVTALRPAHIRGALETAVRAGLSRTTVTHLRDDVSTILDALWRDELVAENWALRVTVPAEARTDGRPRVLLTDPEFQLFQESPVVPEELKLMGLVARVLGGMRTSELHAWDWRHVDLEGWLTAEVPRPKTRTVTRLALPDMLVGPLHLWWLQQAAPRSGPVFPDRSGGRHGKRSWARELRRALWMAEIRRGLTRQTCCLQSDTPETRRVDFHSFRRAYNTGLAAAGVNVQQAMKLAGHRNPATHMRYVALAEALEMPEAALPKGFGRGRVENHDDPTNPGFLGPNRPPRR
jgi:integrase